ncbi:uncharacterized protein LOC143058704 [Mytilus galloprovincialis]|uniref:uncharacterized protein LOC143058704 n=1 Tax=Mytilus galloprovincialis TaxID=29158 RepID=UPI003F7C6194
MLERKWIVLENKFFHDHLKSLMTTMLGIASLLIPYFSGAAEQNCEGKEYWMIFGCFMAILLVLCHLSIGHASQEENRTDL